MITLQRDLYGYAFAAAGGVLLLGWCIPAYSPEYPGYGVPASLVPNVAAGFLLLLALLGLGRTGMALRRQRAAAPAASAETTPAPASASGVAWLHMARFFLPCAALMPAMTAVGFIPAGVAFMLLMQWFCGQRKPLALVVVAVTPVLALYALMRFALGIPLP